MNDDKRIRELERRLAQVESLAERSQRRPAWDDTAVAAIRRLQDICGRARGLFDEADEALAELARSAGLRAECDCGRAPQVGIESSADDTEQSGDTDVGVTPIAVPPTPERDLMSRYVGMRAELADRAIADDEIPNVLSALAFRIGADARAKLYSEAEALGLSAAAAECDDPEVVALLADGRLPGGDGFRRAVRAALAHAAEGLALWYLPPNGTPAPLDTTDYRSMVAAALRKLLGTGKTSDAANLDRLVRAVVPVMGEGYQNARLVAPAEDSLWAKMLDESTGALREVCVAENPQYRIGYAPVGVPYSVAVGEHFAGDPPIRFPAENPGRVLWAPRAWIGPGLRGEYVDVRGDIVIGVGRAEPRVAADSASSHDDS